jgi:AcrR family transcriptional regulator
MATESMKSSQRPYRKRLRAAQEEETRERITEAAVKLHGTVGPARTTVSAVAREAGVQRATVYRHFPTEESLFEACTAHYWARHPLPDPASWAATQDPAKRLRRGLREMYAFFGDVEPMLENTSRDSTFVPAMATARKVFLGYLDAVADALAAGRRERGAARRRTRAALGHAVSFATWQSLIRQQGLTQSQAVAVMAAMIEGAGSARP